MNDRILLSLVAFGLIVWVAIGIMEIYNRCKHRAGIKRRLKELMGDRHEDF
jgi:hypothetical protein